MAKLPFMTGRYKWFLKVLSVCAEFKGEDPDAECRRPTSAKEYNITTDNPALLEKTGIGKSADKKVKIYTPVKTHFYNEKSSKLPFMAGCYEWFFKALPVCECKSEDPNAKHRKPTSTKGNGHLCCVYNWMYPEADPEDKDWKNKKTIEKETKVFNDPIHGHMKLHPLLVRIINTPEFQRLRNIKQLGGAYFVYPGASHNRFEHSIGVGYLAGQLATSLKINQPELDISDQDVLCVQIAGLCHDLGHGPFSHLYDGLFISETEPKTKWKHEKASVDMFEYLVENNGLRRVMKEEYGLNTEGENENDLEFIKEMINRTENEYKGRSKEKSFLYDIVSNKETGIDVDKFDYFARDCYHLGFQSNFDHKRFIMFARVCDVDGKKYICSRDKEAANLYDIFHTRHTIHRRACQHRVTKSVEIMIKDALLKANDEIKIEGSEGKLFSLSEAKGDMEAYVKLTDQVVEEISRSTSESLKDAREIIERIMTRKLYWCVGEAKLKQNQKKISEEEKESLKRKLTDEASNFKDNFEVKTITMDYGMENTDPISKTYFYKKTKPDRAFKIPKAKVSMLLPEYFSETILRVYWKNPEDGGKEKKKESFNQWCKENNYEVYEEDDEATAGTDQ